MRLKLILFFLLFVSLVAYGQAPSAPTIALAGGTYTGVQYGVKVSSTTTGTNIIVCTIDGTTPASNGSGTSAANDGHSFTLQNPGWVPISLSMTLKCISGKVGFSDSSVTSASYVINNANVIPANFTGAQCQSNSAGCNNFTFTSTFLHNFRIWDARSPFYSETSGQFGSNCNWASIESNVASPGTYNWTCLDGWLDAIHAQRLIDPNFTAVWTNGMIPRAEVVTGIPGGSTGFSVTGLTVNTGTTLTLTGTFPTNIQYLYLQLTGMSQAGDNIPLIAGNVGQAAVTSYNSSSSVTVTVPSTAGFPGETGASGKLIIAPGPKGMPIHPDDLPLSAGSNWNGTPPSPGCSPSYHNFVVAMLAHTNSNGRSFKTEVDGIEEWNEPNNNFFWNPNLNSLAQVNQLLECEAPTFRNAMDGTGGTRKVYFQAVSTTASAPTTLQYLQYELTNGRISDVIAYHHYFSSGNPSAAPETIVGTDQNIVNQRNSVPGFPGTFVRNTETSYQATQPPYGASIGSPWTATDAYAQPVRYVLLTLNTNIGVSGVDYYNFAPNCLKVNSGGAFGTGCAAPYAQMVTMLTGGTMGACSNAGASPHIIYQCAFTESSGALALWLWNYCPNDGNYSSCSTNGTSFSVPSGYSDYVALSGVVTRVTTGQSINLSVTPIMLENNPLVPPIVAPVQVMFATIKNTLKRFYDSFTMVGDINRQSYQSYY